MGESAFSAQEKAKALLAIVEKANETVVGIYRDLRANGIAVPQEALDLYDEGLVQADASFALYSSGRYQEARAHLK